MLKLYGHEKSRAFRVLWLLEELALQYEHVRLNFSENEQRSAEFLKLNPSAKVPVLLDDTQIIHESAAILLHLHDKFGQKSDLYLGNPNLRTELYQWLFYGSSELEQGLWTAARHTFILPETERIRSAVDWGRREFVVQLGYLNSMLAKRTFLIDEKFTVADILISQILLWATQQQKIELGHQSINEYLARCTSRAAFSSLVNKLKTKK